MKIYKRKAKGTSLKWNSKYIDFEGTILRISSRMRAWLLVVWKRFREREREALVKEAVHWLLFRYRVGGRIRGEPGAARALSVVVLITASYPGAQAGSNLPLSPPPFPISSSNGPPSISFLPSYFFLPSPRFSPHPAHFLLPHISLAASWLTCEPSWITGEQSH